MPRRVMLESSDSTWRSCSSGRLCIALYADSPQVLRCLRPDRVTTAVADYIRTMLPNGGQYLDGDSALSFYEILESSFGDSTATTPIFFILSPGADPVKEVESLGRKLGYTANFNLHNVALGQARKPTNGQIVQLDCSFSQVFSILTYYKEAVCT